MVGKLWVIFKFGDVRVVNYDGEFMVVIIGYMFFRGW